MLMEMLMENFLWSKEYWRPVETGYIESENRVAQTDAQHPSLVELKLKDLKVKNYPFQAINQTILKPFLKMLLLNRFGSLWKRKFAMLGLRDHTYKFLVENLKH